MRRSPAVIFIAVPYSSRLAGYRSISFSIIVYNSLNIPVASGNPKRLASFLVIKTNP